MNTLNYVQLKQFLQSEGGTIRQNSNGIFTVAKQYRDYRISALAAKEIIEYARENNRLQRESDSEWTIRNGYGQDF